jgi:hypothetical protein
MIRIDEIYYNVFVKSLQHRKDVGFHWFYPFGSVDFNNLCNVPTIPSGNANLRVVFWDQEPLYKETAQLFFEKFCQFDINRSAVRPWVGYDGKKIVVTSEVKSDTRLWLENTYGVSTDYYFFHGWAALDWYRGYNHSFLTQSWLNRKFDHAFICPNNIVGGRRIHRIRFLHELAQRDCIHQNLISFPVTCPYEHKSVYKLFQEHDLSFPKNLSLPLIIDHDRNHADDSHRIDFWEQAMKCFCHVVTETVGDDTRIHITEKTFKPIVLQQPFLMVGNRGALKYLRDYGFQTFSNLWDEGYDDLDQAHRITAVADICQEITSWSQRRLKQAQQEVVDVVKHNHDWFYGGFQEVLWKETCEMIDRWR